MEEKSIKQLIAEELDRRQKENELISLADFCSRFNVSRTTVWRAEKGNKLKCVRIGKKIFINPNQFQAA